MSEKELKDTLENLKGLVSVSAPTFWFALLLLLFAIVMYAQCMRLVTDITPDKCPNLTEEQKTTQSTLKTIAYGGLLVTGFGVIWLLAHYFFPLHYVK